MTNPLFAMFGNKTTSLPGGMNPMQFIQSAKQWGSGLQGNPESIAKMMIQSGRISQEQFQVADQMVRSILK